MKAGVSTACLYPRLLEESVYDLAVNGINHIEIFVNTDSEQMCIRDSYNTACKCTAYFTFRKFLRYFSLNTADCIFSCPIKTCPETDNKNNSTFFCTFHSDFSFLFFIILTWIFYKVNQPFEKGWAKTFIPSLVWWFNLYKAWQVIKQRIEEKIWKRLGENFYRCV